MAGLLAAQLLACTQQRAELLDRLVRNEARPDQPASYQIGDPCRIVHVGLAAGNILDVRRIGHDLFPIGSAPPAPENAARSDRLALAGPVYDLRRCVCVEIGVFEEELGHVQPNPAALAALSTHPLLLPAPQPSLMCSMQ